jgi:hypothetical protein
MPAKRISFANFNRRLTVAGGREQGPPGAVRRAQNVAPELTNSVLSRWGSSLQTGTGAINAIQVYYWNGNRYAYDGSSLYRGSTSIKTGFNGNRLAFNAMPPQPGLQDYLFVLGGGVAPFKIDPSGNITNWGIAEPPDGMGAANQSNDQFVIDTMNTATNWTGHQNCTVSSNSTEFKTGTASLEINPSAGPWRIKYAPSSPLNLAYYTNGDFSLPTDVIQFWIYFHGNFNVTWIELDFDVNDGTFQKDWYSYAIGFVSPLGQSRGKTPLHNVQTLLDFQQDQWQLITIAKSQFLRNGVDLQYDWSNVKAVRFQGGNFTSYMLLDNLVQIGGSAMGAGPAVGNGGSEYDYYVVFRNPATGSISNPQANPVKVFGVEVNKVNLSNIPLSTDPQVGARDLYRTQALVDQPGGGIPFYLDTIPDNTTTTYVDSTADSSFPLVTTPWTASVAVPPNPSATYYIDGGNGYYFKLTTSGTTGSQPPAWVVPETIWSPLTQFSASATIAPRKAAGQFWKVTTAGTSGATEPNWAGSSTPGDTITDGTVVWTNQGLLTTTDGTAVWTFQGINSTPTLGNNQLLYDNANPTSTIEDAWGPHQGSMFFCRDTAPGNAGYVYASPPGRPESLGQEYLISDENDPTQKLVGWDGALWLFTQQRGFQLLGSYPQIIADPVNYAMGTNAPYTVVPVQLIGIVYWAPDGIRVLNWAGSRLLGFEMISPVLRGQAEEDITTPWSPTAGPVWAALLRDEIVFSDGASLTLALGYDGLWGGAPAWRRITPVLTALYYESQTGHATAGLLGGGVFFFEDPGQLTDNGTAIAFELESAGDFPDPGAQFTTQRLYLTLNSGGQTLTPTIIVDGVETALTPISSTSRQTIEMEPKIAGRFFDGVRLSGNITARVEIFRIEADVWLGEGVA